MSRVMRTRVVGLQIRLQTFLCPFRTSNVGVEVGARMERDILVKSHNDEDEFDWLAIVVLPATTRYKRRIFIVPRDVANSRSYELPHWDGRGIHVHKLIRWPASPSDSCSHVDCGLADYEDNFSLSVTPRGEPRPDPRFGPELRDNSGPL